MTHARAPRKAATQKTLQKIEFKTQSSVLNTGRNRCFECMSDGIGLGPDADHQMMTTAAVFCDTTTMRRPDTQKVRHFKIFLRVVHP